MNVESNSNKTDIMTLVVVAQRQAAATWFSLTERVLSQAHALHELEQRAKESFRIIKTKAQLKQYLDQRQHSPNITAGFLAIEGAHALDDNFDNVEVVFDAGVRMMSPVHFFDTELGGSAHGEQKTGLTELGKRVIRKMEELNMIVDVAHCSPATISDILDISTKPVVVSHTGVRGTCNISRNLSDEQLKRIASKGGLIGIGYFNIAVCGKSMEDIVRAIKYTVTLVGVEHVALGSDYDGAVKVPFATDKLAYLTQALLDGGFSEGDITAIMGGNAIKLLSQLLP